MGEIILKGYQCERCSHKWVLREGGNYPKGCPYNILILYYIFFKYSINKTYY